MYCRAKNNPLNLFSILKERFFILDKCNSSGYFWILMVAIQVTFSLLSSIIYELKACTYHLILDILFNCLHLSLLRLLDTRMHQWFDFFRGFQLSVYLYFGLFFCC